MISMVVKQMFFDRKAVTNSTDRASRRVLSRFGAFVRTAARSSIRTRRRISAPGQPPSSHLGLLKKLIYFGFDPGRQSVVIGPTLLHQKNRGGAPELLEYGGTAHRDSVFLDYKNRTVTRRSGRVKYRPRPYMTPAFNREKVKLPALWQASVK